MPVSWCGCSGGLVVTALVALLLVPAQWLAPDWPATQPAPSDPPAPQPALGPRWPDVELVYFPTLDLFFTFTLLLLGLFTYLCEWIQRKLMERRIVKLNQYLGASVERLRLWDAQQEQLECTLKMVHNATSEYNLLLYLLLRQHRCLGVGAAGGLGHGGGAAAGLGGGPPSNCFFDKDLDDEFPFLRGAHTLDV